MVSGSTLGVLTDIILPVFAVAGIGGVLGRRLGLDLHTLQRATFYLFSPALVFDGLAAVEIETSVLVQLALVSVVVFVVNAMTGLVWARFRSSSPPSRAAIAMCGAVPNHGNMGLPIAFFAFGSTGLEIATVVFVIGVLLASTAAIALATFAFEHGTSRSVALAPFRYPTVYAAAAGLAVNLLGMRLPTAATSAVSTLGQASIPLMLVVLGMSFHVPSLDNVSDQLFITANRMVAAPLVAWMMTRQLDFTDLTTDVVILMAAMPVAVNATILARQLGTDIGISVRAVVVSTSLSTVTLTVLLRLLS